MTTVMFAETLVQDSTRLIPDRRSFTYVCNVAIVCGIKLQITKVGITSSSITFIRSSIKIYQLVQSYLDGGRRQTH
jgi:hypothetical protein